MASVFISHACEDKADFVKPLALELSRYFDVWYDEFSLSIGDSLLDSIQEGIRNSDFGIVVISPDFIAKEWPRRELDALFSLQLQQKNKILPVWHKIDSVVVADHLPMFSGILAANTDEGLQVVVEKIRKAVLSSRDRTALKVDYELEIASNTSINEIFDSSGELILHKNIMKFRALKDNVTRHIEHFSTDGHIDNFRTSQGKITSVELEERVYYVTTEFEDRLSKVDWVERTLECDYHDDISDTGGHWVIRDSNPTHLFKLQFIFPHDRPPTRVWTELRKMTYRERHPVKAVSVLLDDGRVSVEWELKHLGANNAHILKWEW